ncbi:MAG: hypothetical protein INF48_15085 [Rhodobacter sp.]|nr:hypothetical protein [Rhodobacter sp.]
MAAEGYKVAKGAAALIGVILTDTQWAIIAPRCPGRDLDAGMKWKVRHGWRAGQARTLARLWLRQLSGTPSNGFPGRGVARDPDQDVEELL